MKMSEIKELGDGELLEKEKDLRDEHFNLKFQHAIGKLENTARLRVIAKDIARVMTEKNLRRSKEGK